MHKSIVVALLRNNDSVLLVKQAYGGHFWTLPGGIVEPEETLVQAILREVKEETGLETQVQGLASLRDRADQTCFVFAVEACGGELVQSVAGEIEAVKWFTQEEFARAGNTIEQFPAFIVSQAFRSGLNMLKVQPWSGYSGPADLFV